MRKIAMLVIAALLVVTLGRAQAQGRSPKLYFLKIPGVDGESVVARYDGAVIASGYEFFLDAGGSYNFAIKKLLDRTTTTFLAAVGSRTVYPTATFFGVNNTKDGALPLIKIVFTNLSPNSLMGTDSEIKGSTLVERVTFTYTQAEVTYYEQKPGGTTVPHTVTIIPSGISG